MTWKKLGNPIPRAVAKYYVPHEWPLEHIEHLTQQHAVLSPINEIISNRRTRRDFADLSKDQISYFLWLTSRVMNTGNDALGFKLTQRPSPSAGAIHPIHIVLATQNEWKFYNPFQHGIVNLSVRTEVKKQLWNNISEVLNSGSATAVMLIAEPGMTDSKYHDCLSLIWRDAGVIIGYMSLVAEALGLNYCPLGITGEPYASTLDTEGKLFGVGIGLLGARIGS